MKTFRMFRMALVAVVLGFAMSSCDNDDDEVNPYKDYPQLIVGKWFNFTPDASMFLNYQADGTKNVVGWDKDHGWIEMKGTYNLEGNQLVELYNDADGSTIKISSKVELTQEKLIHKEGVNSNTSTLNERVHYRVKEQFDITGKYSYLNSAVRVVPAEGKTALQLPEGVTFNGQNSISIDAMHGDRIIDVMKKFFADATFAADGKLNHTMDGEAKVKNYTLNGNNLVFNLYEGSDTYKVNATSFPDEDGDRLFIIIPKQAAWLGGMVDLVEKENEGLKLDAAQIAALEKEFMDTFETFTVILSLSKK
ncbi:MAG: hypothetical protein E7142_00960 [Rikenellaceae bacterium]|nr:hypothetical protein [Rikenellaceae bacterium]